MAKNAAQNESSAPTVNALLGVSLCMRDVSGDCGGLNENNAPPPHKLMYLNT